MWHSYWLRQRFSRHYRLPWIEVPHLWWWWLVYWGPEQSMSHYYDLISAVYDSSYLNIGSHGRVFSHPKRFIWFPQQIANFLTVNLHVRDFDFTLHTLVSWRRLDTFKNILRNLGNQSRVLLRAHHRVALSGASLPVRHQATVVAVQRVRDQLSADWRENFTLIGEMSIRFWVGPETLVIAKGLRLTVMNRSNTWPIDCFWFWNFAKKIFKKIEIFKTRITWTANSALALSSRRLKGRTRIETRTAELIPISKSACVLISKCEEYK